MSGSSEFSQLPQLFFDLLEQRETAKQQARAARAPAPVQPSNASEADRIRRAGLYLAAMPAAVSGQGGHEQTYKAALAVTRGFDLAEHVALELLREYNGRCDPPWTERELEHKVHDAARSAQVATGYLLTEAPTPPTPRQEVLAIAKLPPEQAWRALLTTSDTGKMERTLNNLATILSKHPDWAGVIGYDLFAERMVLRKSPPFPRPTHEPPVWQDVDDLRTVAWLEKHERYRGPFELVCRAITTVARAQAFHPVRDYLRSLRWDGVKRIDSWLATVFGTPDGEYSQAVGRCFLVAAVARAMRPGCKADTMLVLESAQGQGKSTAVRMLCNDQAWFTDAVGEMGSKQAMEALAGRWIVELAELDSIGRSEISAVKAFLSATADKYRPAYGRHVVEQLRQCVFVGTVNPGVTGYLRDETGNRRFWPVAQTRKADLAWLDAQRHQLWAEAVVAFDAGEPWHLSAHLEQLASGEQGERVMHDEWQELIAHWLIGKTEITTTDILKKLFDLDPAKHDRSLQMRIGRCLALLGWKRDRVMIGGIRSYVYRSHQQLALPQVGT